MHSKSPCIIVSVVQIKSTFTGLRIRGNKPVVESQIFYTKKQARRFFERKFEQYDPSYYGVNLSTHPAKVA